MIHGEADLSPPESKKPRALVQRRGFLVGDNQGFEASAFSTASMNCGLSGLVRLEK